MSHPLPDAVSRTQQTCRMLVIAVVGRQAAKAFEGVGHPRVRLGAGGDHQRFVGVALGLFGLALCDRHKGPRGPREQLVPTRNHRDNVVGPSAGGDQITIRECGLGHRGGALDEQFTGGNRVPQGLLGLPGWPPARRRRPMRR